jgi:[ribosomal protein S18]-alanine N-acetyltransferase
VKTVFSTMTLVDLPYIGELEVQCFPAPWSTDTYRNELLHNQFSYYWVLRPANDDRQLPPILAYGGYWLMGEEAHIVTIASHPGYRRQGLADHLLMHMIHRAQADGATSITLEVRVSNRAAHELYTKWGFVEVGLRPRYYRDNNEDARLMTLFLPAEV